MDDRTTRRDRLAAALAGWRGARPAKPKKRPSVYPIPRHVQPDPIEGSAVDRMMERLEADHRAQEFMDRRAKRSKPEI